MKKLFILVVLMTFLKPFWPLVDYAINYEYIVEKLCENRDKPELKCNGKCYLSKQIIKEATTDKKDFSKYKKIKLNSLFIDFSKESEFPEIFFYAVDNNYQWYSNLKHSLFSIEILDPPQIS